MTNETTMSRSAEVLTPEPRTEAARPDQETPQPTQAELLEEMRKRAVEENARIREGLEAMRDGKGILHLEKPIHAGDREFTELAYDFAELSGLEYTEAMDVNSTGATQMYGINHRQCLSLFATAAAKQTDGLDRQDIVSRIGGTDATTAVELAKSFFIASIRAGQKRTSKKL